jgi:NADH:ubiquinone oxidoreductase subunit 6 (subunit J)
MEMFVELFQAPEMIATAAHLSGLRGQGWKMIGMIQWVAYLIAVYMIYRGATDALRDFSEMSGKPAGGRILRAIAAAIALGLIPFTAVMVAQMDQFAGRVGNRP